MSPTGALQALSMLGRLLNAYCCRRCPVRNVTYVSAWNFFFFFFLFLLAVVLYSIASVCVWVCVSVCECVCACVRERKIEGAMEGGWVKLYTTLICIVRKGIPSTHMLQKCTVWQCLPLLRAFPQVIPNLCREQGLAEQYLQGTEYSGVKERVKIEASNDSWSWTLTHLICDYNMVQVPCSMDSNVTLLFIRCSHVIMCITSLSACSASCVYTVHS